MLKQQIQALMQENSILKRGRQIQHERQKEFDEKNQEVQQLKQLLTQYQEQLRKLEVCILYYFSIYQIHSISKSLRPYFMR